MSDATNLTARPRPHILLWTSCRQDWQKACNVVGHDRPGAQLLLDYACLYDASIPRDPDVAPQLRMKTTGYYHETFPTRLVLASPAFLSIGGGVRVLSAIVNTLIVDVSPEDIR